MPELSEDLKTTIAVFPGTFERTLADWAKFKAGASRGLFTAEERSEILAWYREFPTLWETIRPNFVRTIRTPQGSMIDPAYSSLVGRVDRFVATLKGDLSGSGLGIAPVVIAGIIIAGGLGIAGAAWAVSYLAKQANISRLIDEVTAGKISPDILAQAIEAEQVLTNPIADLSGAIKWVAVGVLLFFALPLIERFTAGVTGSNK